MMPPWQTLSLVADRDEVGLLSEALLELGALSVSIEDEQAGTCDKTPIFSEAGEEELFWPKNKLTAVLAPHHCACEITARISQRFNRAVADYKHAYLAQEDWVRLVQSQCQPIAISDQLRVIPSWETSSNSPEVVELILDPGIAFGTGSHPTTRLCLQWLDANRPKDGTVLDYGCGSGILAIAAKKLGARAVHGVDNDEQALWASRNNAQKNQIDALFFLPGRLPSGQYDFVFANILANTLKDLAPLLTRRVVSGGQIVLSGILEEQADAVCLAYAAWFDWIAHPASEGWACFVGRKRANT